MNFPQENETKSIIILDDLNEKEINNDKIHAMFKRGRHNNLSVFVISQDYYELPKKTIRCNGYIFHLFKPTNFLDIHNIYQDKTSMDMILDEFKYLTSTCWNEKCQPLTIDKAIVKISRAISVRIKLKICTKAICFLKVCI